MIPPLSIPDAVPVPVPGGAPASAASPSASRQPPAASLSPDTIIALATPPGAGTCALLRLSGPEAITAAARLLRFPAGSPAGAGSFTACAADLDWDGVPVPVRATFFRAPRSYTREDMVEIVLPGALPLTGAVLSLFLASGPAECAIRPALPGEFTLRAFLGGRIDLSQAEAVGSLIRATSELEERAAERQLRGELKAQVEAIASEVLATLALAEAALDFPDEDLPEIGFDALSARMDRAVEAIDALRQSSALRLPDTGALRAALAGYPNAGKSSLLNALLGRPAAIVAGVAGTTRDPVRGAAPAPGGRLIEWIDLAGFEALPPPEPGAARREAAPEDPGGAGGDELSRAINRLTREELFGAEVVVWVADVSGGARLGSSLALFRSLPARRKVLVLSKADLVGEEELDRLRSLPERPVIVSAPRGRGLRELTEQVAGEPVVGRFSSEPPQFLITARQDAALARARAMVGRARSILEDGGGYELAAVDLREALSALGEITGREVGEKVLDAIFGQFCIGK